MVHTWLMPGLAATLGALWTICVFQFHISRNRRKTDSGDDGDPDGVIPLLLDDRFWASLLCSAAVFMHYYYY